MKTIELKYKTGTITVNYDCINNMWGFALNSTSINPLYETKNEALSVAKEKVIELVDKEYNGNYMAKNGHIEYIFHKELDQFIILAELADSEPCYTNVFTKKIDNKFWDNLENFFKGNYVKSFKFLNDEKVYYNPNKKKIEYIQGELF